MTFADEVSRKLSQIPRMSSGVGVFVSMVGGLARVNFQGAQVDIRCDGWTPPIAGMPVRVETLDSIMRVVGPSQTLSPRGEVLENLDGGIRARVAVDGGEYVLPVIAPYSPVVTDPVVINWFSGHVLGEEAAAPDPVEPPPVGGGGGSAFTGLLVQARSSGKYDTPNANWWGNGDVRASNNNVGAWFYHGDLAVLAGAELTGISLYLPPPWKAVGALFIAVHPHPTRPAGAPSISSHITAPGRSDWVDLPASWGNFFRDNPNAGIAVTSGAGDNQWPGVPQNPMSGALRFSGVR